MHFKLRRCGFLLLPIEPTPLSNVAARHSVIPNLDLLSKSVLRLFSEECKGRAHEREDAHIEFDETEIPEERNPSPGHAINKAEPKLRTFI